MTGAAIAACLAVLSAPAPAPAREPTLPWIGEVGLDQKLDSQVPLGLAFRDEAGRSLRIGDVLGRRPAVLALVYFKCPSLCSQVLSGLLMSLRAMSLTAGKDFDVLVVSINPREGPDLAAEARERLLRGYSRPGAASGLHVLTGKEEAIRDLAAAVGFRYRYEPDTGEYAHASGLVVLTPEGKVSRYLYGIEYLPAGRDLSYSPRDLRFSLIEAAAGKIGTPVDQVLLLCFRYDPLTGKYAVVFDVLRVLSAASVIGLGVLLYFLFRASRRREARTAAETPP